jgi:hypothetical protein
MSIGSGPEIDQSMKEELQRNGSLLMLLVGSREARKQDPPVTLENVSPKSEANLNRDKYLMTNQVFTLPAYTLSTST